MGTNDKFWAVQGSWLMFLRSQLAWAFHKLSSGLWSFMVVHEWIRFQTVSTQARYLPTYKATGDGDGAGVSSLGNTFRLVLPASWGFSPCPPTPHCWCFFVFPSHFFTQSLQNPSLAWILLWLCFKSSHFKLPVSQWHWVQLGILRTELVVLDLQTWIVILFFISVLLSWHSHETGFCWTLVQCTGFAGFVPHCLEYNFPLDISPV